MAEVRSVELGHRECLSHLGTATIGRVVYSEQALPAAQPVCFFLDDEEVIFLAGRDSPLAAAVNHQVVAFQVDDIDRLTHSGWSVCGVGEAYALTHPARLAELASITPFRWAPELRLVCVPLQGLTGRMLALTDDTIDEHGVDPAVELTEAGPRYPPPRGG